MSNPNPVWEDGKWHLDLRAKPWKLGRYVLDVIIPPPDGLPLAIHASWRLLTELRGRGTVFDAQPELPGISGRTLGDLLTEWLAWRIATRGVRAYCGRDFAESTVPRLLKDLGASPLSEFVGESGTRRLCEYRDLVRRGGLGKPISANRLCACFSILRQAFAWARDPRRAWMPAVLPEFPTVRIYRGEVVNVCLDKWIDEATFRAVREAIYETPGSLARLAGQKKLSLEEARDKYVFPRRMLLSFALYTGMRKEDCEAVEGPDVSLDFKRYKCHSRKTYADARPFKCPDPLIADLEAEQARRGRPLQFCGLLCGGLWRTSGLVLEAACQLVGVPVFGFRDLRRSFAVHKAMAGQEEGDVQRLLRHSDSRMIRRVYQQFLPADRADEVSAAWPGQTEKQPGTGQARVTRLHPVKP
jgi:integrase